jgi:hypothetical protein
VLDSLPDGATTTVPFALERALAVESSVTTATEGARLLAMHRDSLTVERFTVDRTTWRVRNGTERPARVMVRQALHGAQLHEPPQGTEQSNGTALVPLNPGGHASAEVIVTTRAPFTVTVDLTDDQAAPAIEQYLREGNPSAADAQALRTALDLRRGRENLEQRRGDLQQSAEETRENLRAIQRNPQAADLRARLTTRLGRVATELDQLTRRIVELDTQIGERRQSCHRDRAHQQGARLPSRPQCQMSARRMARKHQIVKRQIEPRGQISEVGDCRQHVVTRCRPPSTVAQRAIARHPDRPAGLGNMKRQGVKLASSIGCPPETAVEQTKYTARRSRRQNQSAPLQRVFAVCRDSPV